jgi:flagellar hook-associated protein 3 FlgL
VIGGRITDQMVRDATLSGINSSLQSLTRSSEELSSGRKILEPSDNPYGASRVINLDDQLEGLGAYASNVQDGVAWTQAAGSAMANVGDVLQRVREMLVQASNGTLNEGDMHNIGGEVEQLIQAVKQAANTQYAGQYVFAGTATTTAPYKQGEEDTFQANTEPVNRAIGPGSTLNVSMNLSAVLGNGAGSGDGKVLEVLRTIASDLAEATPESRSKLGTSDLKNLDAGMESLTQLEAVTGATTDQLDTAASRIEGLQDALTKALSATQDANVAEVSIAYSSEQAAYSAALRAGANIVQESLLNFLH